MLALFETTNTLVYFTTGLLVSFSGAILFSHLRLQEALQSSKDMHENLSGDEEEGVQIPKLSHVGDVAATTTLPQSPLMSPLTRHRAPSNAGEMSPLSLS